MAAGGSTVQEGAGLQGGAQLQWARDSSGLCCDCP